MASVKFYIKDSKSEKTNIYFFLNYGAYEIVGGKKKYQPLKYYINESIDPKFWNTKTGRVKQDSRFKQYPEFNARLQNIEDEALNIVRRLQNDKTDITHDLLRSELDAILKPEKKQIEDISMEFLDFFAHYMKTVDNGINTVKTYQQTERDLKDYEADKNIKLTFDRVDIDFHDSFIIWLKETRKFAPNTIGLRIKIVKTVMRSAHERGLHNNTDYQKKAFTKPKEATKAVYLNENELSILYHLDLSDNKKLNNVRDWFLIASYTGLRFSDFSRLTKDNIKDSTISIKTQKTGANVVIPFHSVVRAILEKYEYKLPKVISNQKFNEYVKEVCKLAEINEPIIIEETKGNMRMSKPEPKYNLVSAHTARRSFATNAFLAGVPTIQIMKITGHRSERVFLNYIKISEKENADKLKLHPFFNKMMVK
ncbi:site-specific integrase [Dysgonomonas capnocytophagoides]|uniref:site-specific integrase n=1 Tax=Dysgonomonas capnocytophagoides TaxID=45254 RepID=UPI00333ED25C